MEFTISQVAQMLGGKVEGDGTIRVRTVARIQEASEGQIAFLANPKYEPFLYTTGASAIIINEDFELRSTISPSLIRVKDAYSAFTRLLEEYNRILAYSKSGTEEPSFMGEGSTAGEGLYRGAFSYIGSGVKLGKNVKIYPNAFIGDRCVIGNNTIIHPGVRIYSGCTVGNDCELHAGAVIGSDGFGFAPQADGTYRPIPQLGSVVIEDHVTIGANTVVDCATMPGDATVIRSGVRMDNLIQVAHNVEIGKNTVIAAQVAIAGSAKVGENCMIGGQAAIGGHISVANRTQVGGQSGVSKTVKEEGTRVFGTTAIDFSEYFRAYALFRKLPDLFKRVSKLEEKTAPNA